MQFEVCNLSFKGSDSFVKLRYGDGRTVGSKLHPIGMAQKHSAAGVWATVMLDSAARARSLFHMKYLSTANNASWLPWLRSPQGTSVEHDQNPPTGLAGRSTPSATTPAALAPNRPFAELL